MSRIDIEQDDRQSFLGGDTSIGGFEEDTHSSKLRTQCSCNVPLRLPGRNSWLSPRVSAAVGIQDHRVAILEMVSLANAATGRPEKMRWGTLSREKGNVYLPELNK